MCEADLSGKSVLLIVAVENFRDEEFDLPRKILSDAGAGITIAAAERGRCTGMLGTVEALT